MKGGELSRLTSQNGTQMLDRFVRHAESRTAETFPWGSLEWLCSDRLLPGAQQTIGICRLQPQQSNPLHFHPNCEEVLHVLQGQGRHRLGDESIELRTGSTIRIPQGVPHNFQNTGTDELICLIAFSSGVRETVWC